MLGDIYGRLDGSPGSMYYVKKTGGNGTKTGWVAKATFRKMITPICRKYS